MAALESSESRTVDLVAESNHRIANHLSLLAGMVQLQASHVAKGPDMFTKTQVRGLLHETAGKIISIGHLHRKLSRNAGGARIDLGGHLIEHTKELMTSLSLGDRLSVVERVESGCVVTPEQAQSIMLIMGEIVMNAVKHAHPAGLAVSVSIACGRLNDGWVSLEVADDGVGLPEGFDPYKDGGLGLRLIRAMAQTLDAALEIESDSLGLTFRLRIPTA